MLRFFLAFGLFTAAPVFADNELSHDALFAPNTTFPYFETCNELEPDKEKFDLATAATLAQFSLLAYVRDQQFTTNTLAKAGYTETTFFATEGTFAFVTANDTHIVVVFRGTESSDNSDKLTDAKFALTAFDGIGKVHTGFIDALKTIETELESKVASLATVTPRKIWITGHSLGAALATLYGIKTKQDITAIYPIASPRVGGKKFATAFDKELSVYRIVNDNDLVPRIPTEPLYQHIGSTYFITTDGELIVDPQTMDKWKDHFYGHRKFIKRIWKDHWLKGDFSAIPSDYFVDHSPRLYAEALIKLASK